MNDEGKASENLSRLLIRLTVPPGTRFRGSTASSALTNMSFPRVPTKVASYAG